MRHKDDTEMEKLLLDKAKQSWVNLIFEHKEQLTVKVCHEAVKQDGMALQCVPQELRTAELCLLAVKNDKYGKVLYFVPQELRTAELCHVAVKQAGKAIRHVPEVLRTVELCMVAVKQNEDAFWDILPEELRKKEICDAGGINPYRWAEKQDKLGIQWVKFNGLSDETQKEIFDCVEKVYAKFPKLKGLVREIVVKTIRNLLPVLNVLTNKYKNHNDRIELNGALYKDITKLKEIHEQYGLHPVNTDYRSILTHEIGHAITWKIASDTGKDHSTLTESLREEVLKETEFTIEDVANNLSRYAAEDDGSGEKNVADEFIAEAFAEYMDSASPRPIAQKVGEKISHILLKKD
jgi:hypothetical protein